MQASKITLGNIYALLGDDGYQPFQVNELITVKTVSGTLNFVSGIVTASDGTRHPIDKLPVVKVVDDFGILKAQEIRRKADEAAQKAAAEAKLAKQAKAMNLLAKAIGAKAIAGSRYDKDSGYDREMAMVLVGSSSAIEVNDMAWDGLIEFLENVEMLGEDGRLIGEWGVEEA